jgi:hypothetical protein
MVLWFSTDIGESRAEGWWSERLETQEGAALSRQLLTILAQQPEGRELVKEAIEKYRKDETLDFGLISAIVAVGFFYLITVVEIDVDLGWIKVKKAGLPPEKQLELAKSIFPKFLSRIFS